MWALNMQRELFDRRNVSTDLSTGNLITKKVLKLTIGEVIKILQLSESILRSNLEKINN